jgi:cephalosporin hydroxylase
MEKYKKLFDQASEYIGLLQVENEIIPFMEYLEKEVKPQRLLEIGLCQGGSFFLWCKLLEPSVLKLGIDLPNGRWGVSYVREDFEIAVNKHNIEMFAPNVNLNFGDSTDPEMTDWVKEQLGENKLDFLFIDADHTYSGVKKDYINYKDFVKTGGIIAFHDIKESELHKEKDCDVYRFWRELEGDKKEFVDPSVEWGGIGVIKV